MLKRWRRRQARRAAPPGTPATDHERGAEGMRHLREWAGSHPGVEAYVEPATSMTPTTVVLIAATGEWTRRRVSGPEAAGEFARDLSMPVYDVQLTGYPQRMRDWNARQKAQRPPEG